ncbi:hypothetical protein [Candidatus Thiodictyon syntrophicum]|jgi:hypothetical protein|uniref:Uncharacterized protein n=1 Tax=Candidatus Thiodictyon syntrophicum TaxID=1166950 RepID=A0A2K8U4M9_9GAMM|nr:hypothetical protein [Candidatus Thiodictyon syntrophicum]AUB80507.1 hypothetical protein THSYN_05790 [Candidatus Thiodictyon syntrophicum]
MFLLVGAVWAWNVTWTERSEVLAIYPKACGFMLKPLPGDSPLATDTIRRIAYQVEQLCRLPDPNQATGKQPRSPDGAQRNPGAASRILNKSVGCRENLDCAALHPGYDLTRFFSASLRLCVRFFKEVSGRGAETQRR